MATLLGEVRWYRNGQREYKTVTAEGYVPKAQLVGGGYYAGGWSMFYGGWVYEAALEFAPAGRRLFSQSSAGDGKFQADLTQGGPSIALKTPAVLQAASRPRAASELRAAAVVKSGATSCYMHIRVPAQNSLAESIGTVLGGSRRCYWILWVDMNAAPGFQVNAASGYEDNVTRYSWGRSPDGRFWFNVHM